MRSNGKDQIGDARVQACRGVLKSSTGVQVPPRACTMPDTIQTIGLHHAESSINESAQSQPRLSRQPDLRFGAAFCAFERPCQRKNRVLVVHKAKESTFVAMGVRRRCEWRSNSVAGSVLGVFM